MGRKSTCIYCGCGCLLDYNVKGNRIISVKGIKKDDISEGTPCIKGLTINEVYDKNSINHPRIKGKRTSLDKALDYIYERTKDIAPNEVFFNTSGKITNENCFAIQEFAQNVFGTPNIDSCCGRLCHNATVMAMNDVFGTPNLTRMSNVDKIDLLFVIGSEPERNYPVFYYKLLRKKVRTIYVNAFLKGKDVITITPGSETCLLNGLIHELIKKGKKSNAGGFKQLKEVTARFDKRYVTRTCGIGSRDYDELVNDLANARKIGYFHGMALTQHLNSIENVHSLLNLCLLTDGVILSLRGEINVQGAGDVSAALEKKVKGLNIIEALVLSPVKAAFITEFNPFKSLPDLNQVGRKLRKTFIVYFGSYENEASKKADVVIPIASLLESEGTITNGERRIRKVNRVINGRKQLWEILDLLAEKYGRHLNFRSSRSIFSSLKRKVRAYSHVDAAALWKGKDQWADKSVRHRRFMPEEFDGLDDVRTKEYPFILTTRRSAYSFLGNEITKGSRTLKRQQEKPGFYFNEDDFRKLGIKEGQEVVIRSVVSSLKGKAYISKSTPKGIIYAFMHYSSLPVNRLFPLRFDEESFTPNYKCIAVNVSAS